MTIPKLELQAVNISKRRQDKTLTGTDLKTDRMFPIWRWTVEIQCMYNTQRSEFASAVGKYQSFCRGISICFSICLNKKKKKCWGNWILRTQKNTFPRIKKFKKKMLNKKIIFIFHNFQTRLHNTDHLLYYPRMPIFSFHTFAILLHKFARNRT